MESSRRNNKEEATLLRTIKPLMVFLDLHVISNSGMKHRANGEDKSAEMKETMETMFNVMQNIKKKKNTTEFHLKSGGQSEGFGCKSTSSQTDDVPTYARSNGRKWNENVINTLTINERSKATQTVKTSLESCDCLITKIPKFNGSLEKEKNLINFLNKIIIIGNAKQKCTLACQTEEEVEKSQPTVFKLNINSFPNEYYLKNRSNSPINQNILNEINSASKETSLKSKTNLFSVDYIKNRSNSPINQNRLKEMNRESKPKNCKLKVPNSLSSDSLKKESYSPINEKTQSEMISRPKRSTCTLKKSKSFLDGCNLPTRFSYNINLSKNNGIESKLIPFKKASVSFDNEKIKIAEQTVDILQNKLKALTSLKNNTYKHLKKKIKKLETVLEAEKKTSYFLQRRLYEFLSYQFSPIRSELNKYFFRSLENEISNNSTPTNSIYTINT